MPCVREIVDETDHLQSRHLGRPKSDPRIRELRSRERGADLCARAGSDRTQRLRAEDRYRVFGIVPTGNITGNTGGQVSQGDERKRARRAAARCSRPLQPRGVHLCDDPPGPFHLCLRLINPINTSMVRPTRSYQRTARIGAALQPTLARSRESATR